MPPIAPSITPRPPSGPLSKSPLLVRPTSSGAFVDLDCPSIREHQAQVLGDELHAIAHSSRGRIALNLSKVTDLSTAFITTLVELGRECAAIDGRLVVFGLSPGLTKVFHLASTDPPVHLSLDEPQAATALDEAPYAGADFPAKAARSFLRALAENTGFLHGRRRPDRHGEAA